MKGTDLIWLIDCRDVYNYTWRQYNSVEDMLRDNSHFSQDDWDRCTVVKGRKQSVTLKPIVIEVTDEQTRPIGR